MTLDLQALIKNNDKKAGEYRRLYDLYKGKHDILKKEAGENKPNNQIINNFYKHIIDNGIGYWLGKPITILHRYSDAIQEVLDRILSDNEANDLFNEVAKETAIKSRSYLFVYQDELGETYVSRIPAEEMILVKAGRKVTHAVHYFHEQNEKGETETWVEVLDDKTIQLWKLTKDGQVLIEENSHIFGKVPIATSLNNEEEMSDIDIGLESLVNAYNSALSNVKDDIDAYKNAIFFTNNLNWDEKTKKRFKDSHMLNGLPVEPGQPVTAQIISKVIQMEPTKIFLDLAERNIHKFSATPDMSDESFGGNQSGVAIKQRLLTLEAKIGIKERKFTRFIKELISLLAIPIEIETGEEVKVSEFDISYVRNLPINTSEVVDMVVKLYALDLIDHESLVSMLPNVENPGVALEKRKIEKQDEANALYPNMHKTEQTV